MTTMRERKENRIARLEEWADKRQAKANAIFKADDKLRSDLAFVAGQPGIGRSSIFKRTNAREEREWEHRKIAQSMDRRAAGLRPSYDGTTWRLHSHAGIVYEERF